MNEIDRWEARGFDTASRGWGPYSPTVLRIYSKEWGAWHAGWERFHNEVRKHARRMEFEAQASRYQQAADIALGGA